MSQQDLLHTLQPYLVGLIFLAVAYLVYINSGLKVSKEGIGASHFSDSSQMIVANPRFKDGMVGIDEGYFWPTTASIGGASNLEARMAKQMFRSGLAKDRVVLSDNDNENDLVKMNILPVHPPNPYSDNDSDDYSTDPDGDGEDGTELNPY